MKEIAVKDLAINPMEKIAHEWMLVTAGNEERGYNTMTASWGHLGSLWGQGGGLPTAVIYVRPQRYTREFLDREGRFTLSFFSPDFKRQLGYLGTHSGRDGDKVAAVGLTPVFDGEDTYFAEARLVLVCKTLYRSQLAEEGFVERGILDEHYPDRDLHHVYVGQIERVLVAERPEA